MSWLLLALLTAHGPNPALTPGLVRPVTRAYLCGVKWGHDRRFVTVAMKRQVFAAYGIPWAQHAQYEVDHLEPRSLGGADDVANLWPQRWAEAYRKDQRERALYRAMCAGTVTLDAAQGEMRRWQP